MAALAMVGAMAGGAVLRAAMRRNAVGVLDRADALFGHGGAREIACFAYGADPAQRVHLYRPRRAAGALPLVVFFHGGGWAEGDPADYGFVARSLARHGMAVALAGYRLHPSGRYPAMLEDGAAALAHLVREAPAHGIDAARIVLMGHSAGAWNAVMLGLERDWLAAHGVDPARLRGVIGLAGPYDFLPLDDAVAIATFGHVDDLPRTQPLAHVRADAPPMLLLHGSADVRVRPRHSLALGRAAAAAGGAQETRLLDRVGHEGLIMRFARPFRADARALAHVLRFIARVAGESSGAIQKDG